MPVTKVWMICGGGDWTDVSANLVVLPADVDLDAEHKRYWAWIRDVYWPANKAHCEKTRKAHKQHKPLPTIEEPFRTFPQWLQEYAGGREPELDEAEEYHEPF